MGLKGSDYALRGSVPEWVPAAIRRWARDLTYDEVHAMELGLTGLVAGAAWWAGLHTEVAALSLTLVAAAFGLRKLPDKLPVARRVVRREPWYFTTVYLATALLTTSVLMVIA